MTTFRISEINQLRKVWASIKAEIQTACEAGAFEITIAKPKKSRLQEKKWHSMIVDLCATALIEVNGVGVVIRDADKMKTLLVHLFERELIELGEPLKRGSDSFLCPFTLERLVIRPSTTRFLVSEYSKLIEFTYCKGAEWGATWSEKTSKYDDYPELRRIAQEKSPPPQRHSV
ncbi:MAG: hypothetical protein U5M23_01450 [Marinagarivorans sp.]|nr:hypothetical protein [Marinagarivorans sp.]